MNDMIHICVPPGRTESQSDIAITLFSKECVLPGKKLSYLEVSDQRPSLEQVPPPGLSGFVGRPTLGTKEQLSAVSAMLLQGKKVSLFCCK